MEKTERKRSKPEQPLFADCRVAETSPGIIEWLRVGEYKRTEELLADLRQLGVQQLRTGFSWADYLSPGGSEWYRWLIPRLASEVEVLPCFCYTPPSLTDAGRTSAPPRNPKEYADFLDIVVDDLGEHFEWVELWNEPNNLCDWDWQLDKEWNVFSKMIGGAAYWMKERGKRTVLGGMCPFDANWLSLMGERGVLRYIDAIGIHAFPGTWDVNWPGWKHILRTARSIAARYNPEVQLWATEVGFSTWQHDELAQAREFARATKAGADRLYWYSAHDLHPDLPHMEGFHQDERHYHLGLKTVGGRPKLLYRLWAEGGMEKISSVVELAEPVLAPSPGRSKRRAPAMITGGAGFAGSSIAARHLEQGEPVIIYDNLSQPGVERNLQWLCDTFGSLVQVEVADVRDQYRLRHALRHVDRVYHLAAHVGGQESAAEPIVEFEVNARGSLNLLEELRRMKKPPPILFLSTSKLYGTHHQLKKVDEECSFAPGGMLACSKSAAEAYFMEYARSFQIPAVVFRTNCIYGPRQSGCANRNWLATSLADALEGRHINVPGNGRQTVDALYVEDLAGAMSLALDNVERISGQAFNIGGARANQLNHLEVVDVMEGMLGQRPEVKFVEAGLPNARRYARANRKLEAALGWAPGVNINEGLRRLRDWIEESDRVDIARSMVG